MRMTELYAIVTGLVQGVRFRDYVQTAAGELELTGYVRNQKTGAVLVVAQGLPENLKAMVEYLHEGSSLSRVDGVDVEWRSAQKIYDDFYIQ